MASNRFKVVVRIITIEREYGCGAAKIAQKLAERLDWELWDQRLTQEIARLAQSTESAIEQREERCDPLYHRLLKSFALGSYEGNLGVYPIESLDADTIVKISQRVVEEAAGKGRCVIVGRGSQHFLQTRSDTLRFFLYASQENKVRRLISEGTKPANAESLVQTIDRERAAFIKKYFHAEWPNRAVYHAMINTGIGDEKVVQVILSFLDRSGAMGLAGD